MTKSQIGWSITGGVIVTLLIGIFLGSRSGYSTSAFRVEEKKRQDAEKKLAALELAEAVKGSQELALEKTKVEELEGKLKKKEDDEAAAKLEGLEKKAKDEAETKLRGELKVQLEKLKASQDKLELDKIAWEKSKEAEILDKREKDLKRREEAVEKKEGELEKKAKEVLKKTFSTGDGTKSSAMVASFRAKEREVANWLRELYARLDKEGRADYAANSGTMGIVKRAAERQAIYQEWCKYYQQWLTLEELGVDSSIISPPLATSVPYPGAARILAMEPVGSLRVPGIPKVLKK